MLENFNTDTELKFKELSPEEKQKRGILGRLYGPIADIIKCTRNGRRYTESLWNKVFENPIVKEMFAQGGIPGELDHPVDREETDSSRIAIMMPEKPTKDNEGHLIGYFDIIDTPCGRIAYQLAKYGFKLGISSRGSGDTYDDTFTGEETVDEDTYSFNAFDLVLLPACKDARLKLAESFDVKNDKFKKTINEMLQKENDEDKKIMTETLKNMGLDINSSETQENTETTENLTDNEVAEDNGTELIESLQEALKTNQDLQKQVLTLQEQLSVSYTKEIKLQEEINTLKGSTKKLNESVGKLKHLNTQIGTMRVQLNDKSKRYEQQKNLVETYRNRLSEISAERTSLTEKLKLKDDKIDSLTQKLSELNESFKTMQTQNSEKVNSLTNELMELKQDSKVKNKQYLEKLTRSNNTIQAYKKIANEATEKYIECKATQLGVTTSEIKSKLNENYSFNEIDTVCESLRNYKRNISKLPFNISNVSNIGLNENLSSNRVTKQNINPDDEIDDSLFDLIK